MVVLRLEECKYSAVDDYMSLFREHVLFDVAWLFVVSILEIHVLVPVTLV